MVHSDELHVLGSWAVAVAHALDARQLDSASIFAKADIDLRVARDPRSRVPAERMTHVYELAETAAGDPAFGLSIAQYVRPTTLHALGYSLFASRTLDSFSRRIARYFRLVSTNAVVELDVDDNEYHLAMLPTIGGDTFVPQDAWLAVILRFSREIYRPEFSPLRVQLRRPAPTHNLDRFSEFFRAPIEFASNKNVLTFASDDMEAQLPAANAELAAQNDRVVLGILAQMDRTDVTTQVRACFMELLPSGDCSKERVAERLHISQRTLQNKLTERQTRYRDLLNETRRELAEQYMSQGLHSVSEVAYLLGFSEISSFSRAFRSWTGLAPSDYRERNLKSG
jgi:AraC-like DNA-binding protein